MNRKIELLKKIKALADHGIDGEKVNAEQMLADLLRKHKISLSDIEDEKTEMRPFKVKPNQRKIFNQVAYMVIGKSVEFYGRKRDRNTYLDCTYAQFVQIQCAFDFYWRYYVKELDVFQKAFIYKNNIMPAHENQARSTESDKQPDDDEVNKIVLMMASIDRHTLRKQLNQTT